VRAAYFSEVRPVDTIMQVGGFVNPYWLLEFEVDVIVSDVEKASEVGPESE
jgi:hypothetical protein